MGKTEMTQEIEQALLTLPNSSELVCQEVSVSNFMNGSLHKFVDVMRYNRHTNEYTCYEIKVTKTDLKSPHGHNFVGDKNYYVVPEKLKYHAREKVEGTDIGVIVYKNGKFIHNLRSRTRDLPRKAKYALLTSLAKALKREVYKRDVEIDILKAIIAQHDIDFEKEYEREKRTW